MKPFQRSRSRTSRRSRWQQPAAPAEVVVTAAAKEIVADPDPTEAAEVAARMPEGAVRDSGGPSTAPSLTVKPTKCVTAITFTGTRLGTAWPHSRAHGRTK